MNEVINVQPSTDEDEWRARIEAKRVENAARRERMRRAEASQREKPKAPPPPRVAVVSKPVRTRRSDVGQVRSKAPIATPPGHWSHKYTIEEVNKFAREGLSYKRMAEMFGVSRSAFYDWIMRNHGGGEFVRNQPRRFDEYTREEVLKVYNEEYVRGRRNMFQLSINHNMARRLFNREGLRIRMGREILGAVDE